MLKRAPAVVAILLLFAPLAAQSKMDADINTKTRQEENAHSQIMATLHALTDVYGPRVTDSPSLKAAGDPGWANERMSVHIVAPVKDHLEAAVAYERVIEDDVNASAIAIAIAATLYQTIRDEMLPRFPASKMPALPRSSSVQ